MHRLFGTYMYLNFPKMRASVPSTVFNCWPNGSLNHMNWGLVISESVPYIFKGLEEGYEAKSQQVFLSECQATVSSDFNTCIHVVQWIQRVHVYLVHWTSCKRVCLLNTMKGNAHCECSLWLFIFLSNHNTCEQTGTTWKQGWVEIMRETPFVERYRIQKV